MIGRRPKKDIRYERRVYAATAIGKDYRQVQLAATNRNKNLGCVGSKFEIGTMRVYEDEVKLALDHGLGPGVLYVHQDDEEPPFPEDQLVEYLEDKIEVLKEKLLKSEEEVLKLSNATRQVQELKKEVRLYKKKYNELSTKYDNSLDKMHNVVQESPQKERGYYKTMARKLFGPDYQEES
jgi:hypothetical protein